jgi:hypothetical protein
MNENFIYECLSGFQTVLMEIIDAFSDLTTGDEGRESPPPGLSEDTDYPHVYYDYGLDDVCQAKLIERDREENCERENERENEENEENREREENYLDDEDDEFDML